MKTVLVFLLYLVVCYFGSRFFLMSMGEHPKFQMVLATALLMSLLIPIRKAFWFFVLPLSVLACLYAPVGNTYGPPNYQAIASFLATNAQEAKEYISMVPLKSYLKGLTVIVCTLLAFEISRRFELKPHRNKTFLLIALLTLAIVMQPVSFFKELYQGTEKAIQAKEDIEQLAKKSHWGPSEYLGSKNMDYVLVIGESARRDYFNVYGYPIETTPFLKKTPAVIVEGLTAGDGYTIGSLSKMLTQGDAEKAEPDYSKTVIHLAKSAGFKTIWISAQGMVGEYDTPVTSIAYGSDRRVFINKKSYLEDGTVSDFDILPELEKILSHKEDEKRPRLIVLHTLGSHVDTCLRISDVKNPIKNTNFVHRYLGCYATSILKTDQFLERVYSLMKASEKKDKRPFSIVYFSDHALTHFLNGMEMQLSNEKNTPAKFAVPLIKIDSDSRNQRYLKSRKSGLRFTDGLAAWLRISNSQLKPYDLFDGKDDPNIYGMKRYNIKNEEDKAIVFPVK